jgi:cobalt-zinc-cadmium efflux system membrane fusion protein
MIKINKNIFHSCLYLLLLVSIAGCKNGNNIQSTDLPSDMLELSEAQLQLLEIDFAKPDKREVENKLYLNGKVMALPNLQASVSSDIEGKVENVFVLEGAYVKKGQPLVSLRSMELIELQNQYLSSKSEIDFLKIEYQRQKELIENKIGALSEFQITEAKYNAALSKEKAIRAKLEMVGINVDKLSSPEMAKISSELTIVSPINGYVHALPVIVGMLASNHTILAEIINTDDLHSVLYAYDKDIEMIEIGQPVEISFINHSFPHVKGTVTSIERVVDNQSKSINVHVKFHAPDKSMIFHDMNIRATIETKDKSELAHAVLIKSLLQEEDTYYVFYSDMTKTETGKFRLKKARVTVGEMNEEYAEISFLNPVPDNIFVAQNNVLVLETERKKHLGASARE